MKNSREVILAGALGAFLALVPGAASAQHGGGGGHFGGGGGSFGGGRSSSAPAPARSSAPSNSGGSHASSKSNSSETNSNANKTTTTSGSTSATSTTTGTATTTSTGAARGWSTSSSDARTTSLTPYTANGSAIHTTGSTAALVRPFNPNRPVYGYYPYYYYPYFGFGGLGLYYGSAFGPCDPFWGCYGFGFGYGAGVGYGYGAGVGYGYPLFGASVNNGTGANDGAPGWSYSTPSPDGSNTLNANPNGDANGDGNTTQGVDGTVSTDGQTASPSVSAPGPTVMLDGSQPAAAPQTPDEKSSATLYLTDGSSVVASDHWLSEGKLHYVTPSGAENTVDATQLDLQRTVDENAKMGVAFSLKPAPAAQPQQ